MNVLQRLHDALLTTPTDDAYHTPLQGAAKLLEQQAESIAALESLLTRARHAASVQPLSPNVSTPLTLS